MSEKFGLGSDDTRVRREFASTLHTRPIALYVGSACGILAGLTAYLHAATPELAIASLLLALIAFSRSVTTFGAARLKKRAGNAMRAAYWTGAIAYAANAGLAAGLSMHPANDPQITLLLVSFALIFGAGMALGNSGRPLVALGQMALTMLPVVIAAAILGTPAMLALAVILPAMIVSLSFLALRMYGVLAGQVRLARESSEIAERMSTQARTDSVTGLASRIGFDVGAPEILAAADPQSTIALFWLDLDRFKEVNDVMGHQTGDRVLEEVGERLRNRAPENALIARFGSDEFLLLAELPSRRDVEQLAGRISNDIAAPFRLSGARVEIGTAIGVEIMDRTDPDLERSLQNAGLALYHARTGGRNQLRFFDAMMTRDLVRKKEIEAELRAAIQRDELSVYFQPIIDLQTGRIRAFEALVRWFHPEKGELPPDEFIPVAEDTGLIITLGNWITRQAARACAAWPEHIRLAVNLSPAQIRAPGGALGILRALEDAGLSPERLELEVTESLFLEDDAQTASFMDQLARQGVQFALDDFGTGYSSLHYINKYPFRTIKVDRSFVSGARMGRRSDAIIRAVAEMGATLGMETVAEGLETVEQVEAVREAGCTLGQGYHFSRAVPAHLALLMLEEEMGAPHVRRAAG